MADRAFRVERVKSPPSQELYELDNPHGKITHGRLVVIIEFDIPQQLTRAESEGQELPLMRLSKLE